MAICNILELFLKYILSLHNIMGDVEVLSFPPFENVYVKHKLVILERRKLSKG